MLLEILNVGSNQWIHMSAVDHIKMVSTFIAAIIGSQL